MQDADGFLRANINRLGWVELGKRLGLSASGVRARAKTMGLTKTPGAVLAARKAARKSLEERFWAEVPWPGDGCWVWSGGIDNHGYGYIYRGHGDRIRAHRLSWEIHNGPIPPGMVVRHGCDNPPCVNPAHLTIGTQSDNVEDMVRRGRSARGERHSQSRLTSDDVRAIRRLRIGGAKLREIAAVYGVHSGTVGFICRGETWKDVAI